MFSDITGVMLAILVLFFVMLVDIIDDHGWGRGFMRWLWHELKSIRIDWVKLFKIIIAFIICTFLIYKFGLNE